MSPKSNDEPSSHQMNKDGPENLDQSQYEPSIPSFTINPHHLEETTHDVQALKPSNTHSLAGNPLQIVEEEKSSKQSQQGTNQLKGEQSALYGWQRPNMDWTKDLCRQTQCLKKVTGICDWFKALGRKQQLAVVICIILLTAAIITPCVLLPLILVPPPPEGMFMSPYEYNGTVVSALFVEGRTKNNHSYYAHATHRKIQVPHPTLEAVNKMVRTSSNQEEIHCNVPILSVLAVCGFSHKQEQAYEDWLQYFNNNPREATEKLVETMRSTLMRTGTYKFGLRVPDNLTLVSLKEGLEIDIEYLPLEMKFAPAKFDEDSASFGFEQTLTDEVEKNLLKQEESRKEDPTNSSSQGVKKVEAKGRKNQKDVPSDDPKPKTRTADQKQRLMARAMIETVYYIKRVVSRNVQVLRAKSVQLMDYQQQLGDDEEFSQEWQKALVYGCRTVESLRFRCKIEAAEVLVPGLTLDSITKNLDYVVSQTLSLIFKEVKEIVE